ncbi:hypothetical protein FB451DRAFT_1226210, partial [Mycena latifolia]
MDEIPASFPRPCNHRLEAKFITEVFASRLYHPISNPELLTSQAISHFMDIRDPVLESQFYVATGDYYSYQHNMSAARTSLEMALQLSKSSGDFVQHSIALISLARLKHVIGEYHAAQMHAREAQRSARSSGNLYLEARSLYSEANCCTSISDYRHSSLLLSRARELLRFCGLSGGNLDHNMMDRQADIHLLK